MGRVAGAVFTRRATLGDDAAGDPGIGEQGEY